MPVDDSCRRIAVEVRRFRRRGGSTLAISKNERKKWNTKNNMSKSISKISMEEEEKLRKTESR